MPWFFLSLMSLCKNSDLTVSNTDSSFLYQDRSYFYYVCAASGAGVAVTIVKAERFCEPVIFFRDFIVPGANDAFWEVPAASYKVKLHLCLAFAMIRNEMYYA
jgi:hypothetical protein